eukprot:SAG31_NODE_11456_length_1028_cov_0.967707_2_plen_145_part_01
MNLRAVSTCIQVHLHDALLDGSASLMAQCEPELRAAALPGPTAAGKTVSDWLRSMTAPQSCDSVLANDMRDSSLVVGVSAIERAKFSTVMGSSMWLQVVELERSYAAAQRELMAEQENALESLRAEGLAKVAQRVTSGSSMAELL